MKNITGFFFVTIIIGTINLYGQQFDQLNFKNNEKDLSGVVANSIFNYLSFNDPKAKQRIDSIKVILRKRKLSDIKGKWQFITSQCSDCAPYKDNQLDATKQFLIINQSDILFYKGGIKKNHLLKKEPIYFSEQFALNSNLTDLVFTDSSIMNLSTDTTNTFLKIYKSGKVTENNIAPLVSGIIINYYKRIK